MRALWALRDFLCLAGLYCAMRLHESRGARTFLGIVALCIPAHFVQLGAMVYAPFADQTTLFKGHGAFVRDLATYQAPSYVALALIVVAGLMLVVPLTYCGFSSLLRTHARSLTLTYLGMNALLLVPVREVSFVMGLVAVAGVLLVHRFHKQDVTQAILTTKEAFFARGLLFVPMVILIARSFLLHGQSAYLGAVFCVLLSAFYLGFVRDYLERTPLLACVEVFGVLAASLGWIITAGETFYGSSGGIMEPYVAVVLFLPIASFLYACSLSARVKPQWYEIGASGLALWVVMSQMLAQNGLISSLIAVVVALLVGVDSIAKGRKFFTFLSGAVFLYGLGGHIRYAIVHYLWHEPMVIVGLVGNHCYSWVFSNRKEWLVA